MILTSLDIILGIDNPTLILLSLFFAIMLYGALFENDVIMVLGLVAILLIYVIRIRNRKRTTQVYKPEISAPI